MRNKHVIYYYSFATIVENTRILKNKIIPCQPTLKPPPLQRSCNAVNCREAFAARVKAGDYFLLVNICYLGEINCLFRCQFEQQLWELWESQLACHTSDHQVLSDRLLYISGLCTDPKERLRSEWSRWTNRHDSPALLLQGRGPGHWLVLTRLDWSAHTSTLSCLCVSLLL